MASAALVTISAASCAVAPGFRSPYAARAAASSRVALVTVKSRRNRTAMCIPSASGSSPVIICVLTNARYLGTGPRPICVDFSVDTDTPLQRGRDVPQGRSERNTDRAERTGCWFLWQPRDVFVAVAGAVRRPAEFALVARVRLARRSFSPPRPALPGHWWRRPHRPEPPTRPRAAARIAASRPRDSPGG